ncbi:extracellular solute-binding protein [Haloechinothrix sp. LS1_15]|uniref:ABC transporter substrate-binding protein n=1 Tax=Haloechinothrix sp. LS1_15 TaxID=2652248 RepID=UPI0029472FB3|nr:extracellular solute-binding protein [Haloechinothrix sp. LS1_15]MDV6012489.1 extracellular solute-binding protein [Haloechinothrix sp. LS1_15]
MSISQRPRGWMRAGAIVAAGTLGTAAACTAPADEGDPDEPTTITVDVFGNFGYSEAGLYEEFEEMHPDIEIRERGTGMELGDYDERLTQWLAAGSGTGDIIALEEGILTRLKEQPDHFVDLYEHGAGDMEEDFLDWKWEQGHDADGDQLLGLGTDVGGLAMCYRVDLFEKAGLPTDRDEVSELWPTWDDYIDVGERFREAGLDAGFLDAATNTFNAILMQRAGETTGYTYFDEAGEFVVDDNPAVKDAWDTTLGMLDAGLSANLMSFSDQWNSGFRAGTFATIACPAWMLGYIEDQAGDAGEGKWDVATIPGEGGNWGGSFLAVSSQSEHQEEAAELARFLTSPESHLKVFQALGNLPSTVTALAEPELLEHRSEYFNDAPVGEIFGTGAQELDPVYLGADNQPVRDEMENALRAIEEGTLDPGEAWETAVNNAERVGR